ncbi:MAG: protein translocase subunit SecF [bacterium]
MIELISPNTRFDFVGFRKKALTISLALCVLCIGLMIVRGPKLGVDFAGGSLVQVRFKSPTQADDLRNALRAAGFDALDIQDLGREQTEFLVRVPLSGADTESGSKKVISTLTDKYGADQVEVLRIESVGPRVGEALRGKALLAVLFSTLMMGCYIWIRFEWRYGLGAIVALLHDVIITVGALIVFGYEFDLTTVAALLTVVGFSVNDTVIVSDRIRENRRRDRRAGLAELINTSVNETLSRTLLTSGTAIMVTLALYLLGGSVIHGFAFALLVGFVVGTYSSIFIAAPVVLYFERNTAPGTADRRPAPAAPAARRT